MRLSSLLLGVLIVALAWPAWGIRGHPKKMRRVLCLGDSMTAGVVSDGGTPYAQTLAMILGSRYEVINAGGSGTSALDWVRDQLGDLPPPLGGAYEQLVEKQFPCDVAVVELGGNDATGFWEQQPTHPMTYMKTIKQIVGRLVQDGCRRVIVLTVMPNPGAGSAVAWRLDAYRYMLLSWRTPRRVSVVDIYSMLDVNEDFEGTNCHPNERGHTKIAMAVARSIRGRRWWRR